MKLYSVHTRFSGTAVNNRIQVNKQEKEKIYKSKSNQWRAEMNEGSNEWMNKYEGSNWTNNKGRENIAN